MAEAPALREVVPSLRRSLRRFGPELRKQRLLLVGATLFIILETAMRLVEPWPLKFVLDQAITTTPTEGSSGIGFIDALSPDTLLLVCGVAVAVAAALRAGFSYLSTVALALAGNRMLTEIRGQLYRHVQRLSLRFHSKARAGDLLTRIIGDIGRLQEVMVTAALPLFANTLTLVGMAIVMFLINWQLALVALALFPLFSPAMVRSGGKIRGVARKQRKQEGEMAAVASESLGAIKVVQALGLEKTLEKGFAASNHASLKEGVQGKRLAAGLERRVDVLVGIGTALVLWFGALQVRKGAITPGDLVVFLMYLKTAFKPMRDLAKYTGRLAQAAAAAERVVELMDTEPDVRDRPGAVPAPALAGHVRFEQVSFAYDYGERLAICGLDLDVPAGTRVALVGPSGAGKSTLASLVPRLYDPIAGRITVDGHDLRDLTLESYRAQVAVVLQESVLFGVSIRDNIAWGTAGATDDDVEAAARLANAHDFISALPEGYETVMGERGATVSGGQRQRIALARAAVRDAPILVFDEPTTGLDEANEREVSEALNRLSAGRTTFLIAHALATVEHADLILYLHSGRVVERGTHAELLALGGAYAAAHALQSAERARHRPAELAPAR
ncbi:MAG: ABC transporter ATP-binding protein [Solirubrobacterales bacterium]|nr:ABC transporter ATP-binding protein [Solirubrobacterales bacterium]